MATQTGSIDLKAGKKAHDDAEKVATNYVADISNGILVHPDNDNTNGVQITNKVDIIRDGNSVAMFGEFARIGKDNGDKIVLNPGELYIQTILGENAISIDADGESLNKTITKSIIDTGQNPYIEPSETVIFNIDVSELQNGDTFTVCLRTVAKANPGTIYSLWEWDIDEANIDFTVSSTTQTETVTLGFATDWSSGQGFQPIWTKSNKNVTVVYNPSQSTISITSPDYVKSNTRIQYSSLCFVSYYYNGVSLVPKVILGGSMYLNLDGWADIGTKDNDLLEALNDLNWTGDVIE